MPIFARKITAALSASLIFMSGTALANSHTVRTLSLSDAVDLALRMNPDIKRARIQRTVDKYALVVAKNEFEPQYTFSFNRTSAQSTVDSVRGPWLTTNSVSPSVSYKTPWGMNISLDSANPIGETYNPSLTLKIVEPLMKGFGPAVVEAALENAFDNDEVSQLALKTSIIDTITSVINAYTTVVSDKRSVRIASMNVKRKIDSRDQTNTHIKAGDLPKTSAVEASADVASAEASLENAANQLTTDRLTLLDLLGLDSEANIEVTADMPVEFFKVPDLLTAKKRALENNISYITAQITIETTRRNVITARDGQNWELDLTGTQVMGGGSGGGANAHFKSLSTGANMGSTISLDLTIPIDDVSAKQTVIAAKGSLEQAEILLSEDKRQLQLQVTQKIYALQSEKKEIELSKSSVKYYEQDVKNAEKLYNAGRISQFEYVNRQDNLTTAQQNLLSAKTQYFNDLVALDATLSHTLETWDIHMKDDR